MPDRRIYVSPGGRIVVQQGTDLIAPLAAATETDREAAQTARDQAVAAAGLVVTAAILTGPAALIGGNPNEVSIDLPDTATITDQTLIRFDLPATTTGPLYVTTNLTGRTAVLDQNGVQIGADRQLEAPTKLMLAWNAGGTNWGYFTESRLGLKVEELDQRFEEPQPDPLDPIKQTLIETPHGVVANSGGTISRTNIIVPVLGVGSSVGNGAGADSSRAPNLLLVNALEALRVSSGVQYVSDNQSQGGEVASQFEAQRLSAGNPGAARILTVVSGMNDAFPASYFAGQTFSFATTGGRQSIEKLLWESHARGEMQVVWTSVHPHPDRFSWSLPGGTNMIYPVGKAAPVSPADLEAAIGTHLVERDWTGGGNAERGLRTMWHWNEMLRQIAREVPTCLLLDAEYAWFRWGVEVHGYDALYNEGQYNHPKNLGYDVSYGRTAQAAARAICMNDLSRRYFRGDEFAA